MAEGSVGKASPEVLYNVGLSDSSSPLRSRDREPVSRTSSITFTPSPGIIIAFPKADFHLWQHSIEEEAEDQASPPQEAGWAFKRFRQDIRSRERDEEFVVPQYNRQKAVVDSDSLVSLTEEERRRRELTEPYSPLHYTDEDTPKFFTSIQLNSNDSWYENVGVKAKFIGHYLLGDCLGEGSYAKVKEALDSRTLQRFAVKIFSPSKLKRIPNGLQNVKVEIKILRRLKHSNVCCLREVLRKEAKNKTYMVIELGIYCVSDLAKTFPGGVLPLCKSHDYFVQTLRGLFYCHSQGVIHKDIKPSNLVITSFDVLKIIDFGVAEQLSPYAVDDRIYSSQGSPAVQSPEVADGVESFSGRKLDVWSCGVSLFNLVLGIFPFEEDNVYELFTSIASRPHSIPTGFRNEEPDLCNVIDACLAKKEEDRPLIRELFNFQWVRRNYPVAKDSVIQTKIDKSLSRSVRTFIPYIQAHYRLYGDSAGLSPEKSPCSSGDASCDNLNCPSCHNVNVSKSNKHIVQEDAFSRKSDDDSGQFLPRKGSPLGTSTPSPDDKGACSSFSKRKMCRLT